MTRMKLLVSLTLCVALASSCGSGGAPEKAGITLNPHIPATRKSPSRPEVRNLFFMACLIFGISGRPYTGRSGKRLLDIVSHSGNAFLNLRRCFFRI